MKILVTAPPRIGKSTVIDSVVREFPGRHQGIVARELLDKDGIRNGFTSISAAGESKQFMFRTDHPTEDSIGGEFDVDVEAIDTFVVPELQRGLKDRGSLTYIDEIGRAQAKSQAFLSTVRSLLGADNDNNILGAIVYDDEPWSMEFKNAPGVWIIEVSERNRNALPKILMAAFGSASLFSALNIEQQGKVFFLLRILLNGNQFIAARKLFDNAVAYVAEKRIRLLKEEGMSSEFVISGHTRDHTLVWNKTDKSFACDCDLANGRGIFKNGPEPCSHQLSVLIAENPIDDISRYCS